MMWNILLIAADHKAELDGISWFALFANLGFALAYDGIFCGVFYLTLKLRGNNSLLLLLLLPLLLLPLLPLLLPPLLPLLLPPLLLLLPPLLLLLSSSYCSERRINHEAQTLSPDCQARPARPPD
jgi:hypothetical protein